MDNITEALRAIDKLSNQVNSIISQSEMVKTGLTIIERTINGLCSKMVTIKRLEDDMNVEIKTFCGKTFGHEGECVADEKREHIFISPVEAEEPEETSRTRKLKELLGDE